MTTVYATSKQYSDIQRRKLREYLENTEKQMRFHQKVLKYLREKYNGFLDKIRWRV